MGSRFSTLSFGKTYHRKERPSAIQDGIKISAYIACSTWVNHDSFFIDPFHASVTLIINNPTFIKKDL